MSQEPQNPETDIAVVGMSLRVPGAANPRQYWRNVRSGHVSVRRLGHEELVKAGVAPHEIADRHYVPFAAPLEGVGDFDPEFFGFGPKEAAILDPQHRHFYECAWEALEDAGWDPQRFEGSIGVFGGCGMPWYFVNNVLTNPGLVDSVGLFLLRHTGNDKDFLATRVSYALDLKGPSVNVQTACSTSLVAVHLACQSLLSGECDMALAGGVTLEIPHGRGYHHKEGEILAPDGVCRPFDVHSAGTVFGSGAGVVVLRRLADALADGDPIHAVIKGSAVNNDGSRKVGYLAPSVDGQAAAIVEALAVSGCKPETIAYVEAHGTGTAVGDPIEIAALTEAFRRTTKKNQFCGVGSVKANIGHLDTAAGVASFVKAIGALQAREIPPTPNFTAPNPTIDFARTPFYVASELRPMTSNGAPLRVGVTSLGVGGTNAHVILEEAPAVPASTPPTRAHQLLCLSARTKTALDGNAKRLAERLRELRDASAPVGALADVAWTLHRGRRAFAERRVLAAKDWDEAIALLESNDTRRVFAHSSRSKPGEVAFLFPGGGAQHVRMGAGLYRTERVYRDVIDRGIELCRTRFGLDLTSVFFPADDAAAAKAAEELLRPSVQLPAIFLVEYAQAQLWMHLGVQPKALLGHSMGENTAACVAGVASFEDTLTLVRRRGELFERVQGGGMASVAASRAEIDPILPADLDLATVNAPGLCVVSGPVESLAAFARVLAEREIDVKTIPISIAAHSRGLDPILADFELAVRAMKLSPPRIPFVSNATGTWITPEQATDPRYWVEHLRGTVRFAEGMETLLADESRVFLEVGPGKVLSSLARAQASFRPGREAVSSSRHPDEAIDDAAFFTTAFGRLWAAGVDVDVGRLWHGERRRKLSLPTYAFDHRHCWIEPGHGSTRTIVSDDPEKIEDVSQWFRRPAWREEVLDAPTLERATGQWLLFVDRGGVGHELATRLRARGASVVIVRDGDAFARVSDDEYVLSPEYGRDGYDALISDLVARGRMPASIVHLWLTTHDESFRPGSSFFHRNQEHGFYSLLFLSQALADQGGSEPMRLFVVSNGMQRVGDEVLAHPDKATALGPCRVVPRELTHVSCTSVDVELPRGGARRNGVHKNGSNGATSRNGREHHVVDEIETEILRGPCRGTVAWRHGRRFVERHERCTLSANAPGAPTRLRARGTYVVTGGLGGIGLVIARWLATSVQARLVLLSRVGLPPREHWNSIVADADERDEEATRIRAVQELEASGAEVTVSTTDVTDVDALDELAERLRATHGAVNGVFHAAGLLRDGLLQTRTQMDVEDVFSAKVHGTMALERFVDRFAPDFTVVFSSTSAVLGPVGQIDYTAANAFLDAWAESRTSRGKPTIALAWGIWKSVGMAARAGAGGSREERGTRTRSRLLSTHRRESNGRHVFEAAWSSRSHWMLDEHRTLEGRALLPGTGYLELARVVLSEIGEDRPFDVEDLVFLEPLFVPEQGTVDVRVTLRTGTEGHAFEVESRSAGGDEWNVHAQGRIVVRQEPDRRVIDVAALTQGTRHDDPRAHAGGTAGVQADRLKFGSRWQVLRARRTGERVAWADLSLPQPFVDDLSRHGLHPALLDVALHVAVDRIGEHAGDLWVPMSFDRVRILAELTPRVIVRATLRESRERDTERAAFDVVVADDGGRVLMEVDGFTLKHMSRGFAAVAPVARESGRLPGGTATEEHDVASPIEAAFRRNLERGIAPHEGLEVLSRVLAQTASGRIVASSLDLEALDRQAIALAATAPRTETKFERPDLSSEYAAPRDEVEKTIVGFWEELLGVDPVGVRDDFFALGGHSLIAVRLFTRIKKAFHVEFPISVLFEAPTIERCAELVRRARGPMEAAAAAAGEGASPDTASSGPVRKHVVAMHSGEPAPRTPFFLVAGMFGNVLNLRHLAHLVGGERPFYGVQAKGLYGEDAPHESFEEMAAAYLAEIRQVQPKGPYLLGGFSGGGIAAYEMTRQLLAAGEEVAALVMLDTPLPKRPPLHAREKLLIHVQRARKQGIGYFKNWVDNRVRWEDEKRRQAEEARAEDGQVPAFHSRRIQAAFTRALDHYDVTRLPITIALFRPRLDVAHVLGEGRVANVHRELLFHDNGWKPFVDAVEVHEVPGDHDSMVLEPNVRVLAQKVRRALEAADRRSAARTGVRR